jgi:putative DNA primase/helicase
MATSESVEPATTQPDPAGDVLRGLTKRTDLGNAERLAARAKGKLLWVYGQGWLWWDGKRWRRDESNRVVREAKATVRAIYGESSAVSTTAGRADDGDRETLGEEAKKISSWAIQSESRAKIDAMIALARSEPRLVLEEGPTALDAKPTLLNVQNGTLDLETLALREHSSEDRLTKITRAAYEPNAEAPFFAATLAKALPDEELRHWVMRALAYSILGTYSEYLFIPWGSGANLKSTILYGLRYALGDYAAEAASDLLVARREWGASAESALAGLRGARFVTTVETEQGKKLAEVLVKQLTGEVEITAKFMRQDYFTYQNQASVWLATNHKPIVQGMDYAIWRRLRLIPFTETIAPEDRMDPAEAHRRLRSERDGILRWLVEALRDYRSRGLEPAPDVVTDATAAYRAEMEPLAEWLAEECELLIDDPQVLATASDLRSSYEQHCKHSGRQPLGAIRFGEELRRLGLTDAVIRPDGGGRKGRQARVWRGIRTRPLLGPGS